MAYGQHCRHCWWQEIDHFAEGEKAADADPEVPRDGYKFSAEKCPGFKPEDPEDEFGMAMADLSYLACETPSEFHGAVLSRFQESPFNEDVASRMKIQFAKWMKREKAKASEKSKEHRSKKPQGK